MPNERSNQSVKEANKHRDKIESMSSSSQSVNDLVQLLKQYPLSTKLKKYDYGTAGFRYPIQVLDGIMVRVGIIVVLRGISGYNSDNNNDHANCITGTLGSDGSGNAIRRLDNIGCMITASHNTKEYNGVKIIDVNGGMVSSNYENLAYDVANIRNVDKLLSYIQSYINKQQNTTAHASSSSVLTIHVGHDTRSHSPRFTNLIIQSINCMQRLLGSSINLQVKHHGIVTTPLLHHLVLHSNSQSGFLPLYITPSPTINGYYDLLAHSYINLLRTLPASNSSLSSRKRSSLIVDCACGVGYYAVKKLDDRIKRLSGDSNIATKLIANNGPTDGVLNELCGSEIVQKKQCPPKWWNQITAPKNVPYGAAIDGDADRIVFFANNATSSDGFILLDGDQIACLICKYLQQLINVLSNNGSSSTTPVLTLGVVQTAYANGASTQYLKRVLGVDNVKIAKTGVKYVHHMAETSGFDISVYFEANGHGTVLFNNESKIKELLTSTTTRNSPPMTITKYNALQQLRLLTCLINPAVGDAMSDLLLIDFCLKYLQLNLMEWKSSLYKELPSKQLKVNVPDRKCKF